MSKYRGADLDKASLPDFTRSAPLPPIPGASNQMHIDSLDATLPQSCPNLSKASLDHSASTVDHAPPLSRREETHSDDEELPRTLLKRHGSSARKTPVQVLQGSKIVMQGRRAHRGHGGHLPNTIGGPLSLDDRPFASSSSSEDEASHGERDGAHKHVAATLPDILPHRRPRHVVEVTSIPSKYITPSFSLPEECEIPEDVQNMINAAHQGSFAMPPLPPPPAAQDHAPSSSSSSPETPRTPISSFAAGLRTNQVDIENDARTKVPYAIEKETFDVPLVSNDDLLVGDEALWCPGKPLRIAYVTWNMSKRPPRMGEVSSFCIHPNAHIIVVGTQENGPYVGTDNDQRRWERAVGQQCLNNQYTLVKSHHTCAIHIMVFARSRDVAAYVVYPQRAHVKTGLAGGMVGNKGGVAVAMALSMVPQAPFHRPSTTSSPVAVEGNGFSTSSPLGLQPPGQSNGFPHSGSLCSDSEHTTHATSSNVVDGAASQPSQAPLPTFSPVDSVPSPWLNGSAAFPVDESDENPAESTQQPAAPAPNYVTLLFVTAHLAAHQRAVRLRNRDYRHIVRGLRVGLRGPYRRFFRRLLGKHRDASRKASSSSRAEQGAESTGEYRNSASSFSDVPTENAAFSPVDASESAVAAEPLENEEVSPLTAWRQRYATRDVTNEFDLTLFGGDLNYRINGTRQAIEYIVQHHSNIRSILINNDQLSMERAKGTVFRGFREGRLHFRPTYKYEISRGGVTLDQYNFSHKKTRMPAYCDRVLFKRRPGGALRKVSINLYTDVPSVRTSDHRPVVAILDVETQAAWGNKLQI